MYTFLFSLILLHVHLFVCLIDVCLCLACVVVTTSVCTSTSQLEYPIISRLFTYILNFGFFHANVFAPPNCLMQLFWEYIELLNEQPPTFLFHEFGFHLGKSK